ncbi:hypothetical protein TYRP_011280 [Tyrophagus putrescentiae]|nr:hypothetical protein TYRP_011280 [Tyrophagus putrescentiae]
MLPLPPSSSSSPSSHVSVNQNANAAESLQSTRTPPNPVNMADNSSNHREHPTRYICRHEGCFDFFTSRNALFEHDRLHTRVMPFRCSGYQCAFQAATRDAMLSHLKTVHSEFVLKLCKGNSGDDSLNHLMSVDRKALQEELASFDRWIVSEACQQRYQQLMIAANGQRSDDQGHGNHLPEEVEVQQQQQLESHSTTRSNESPLYPPSFLPPSFPSLFEDEMQQNYSPNTTTSPTTITAVPSTSLVFEPPSSSFSPVINHDTLQPTTSSHTLTKLFHSTDQRQQQQPNSMLNFSPSLNCHFSGQTTTPSTTLPLTITNSHYPSSNLPDLLLTSRFICPNCTPAKTFSVFDQFRIHSRTHSQLRPYRCKVQGCSGFQANQKVCVKIHIEKTHKHLADAPYEYIEQLDNALRYEMEWLERGKRDFVIGQRPGRVRKMQWICPSWPPPPPMEETDNITRDIPATTTTSTTTTTITTTTTNSNNNRTPTFICKQCNRGMFSYESLCRHDRSVHNGIRPYRCTYQGCLKRFIMQGHIKKSPQTYSQDPPQPAEPEPDAELQQQQQTQPQEPEQVQLLEDGNVTAGGMPACSDAQWKDEEIDKWLSMDSTSPPPPPPDNIREEHGDLPEEEDVEYEEDEEDENAEIEEAAELEGVDEENQGDHALSLSTLTASPSSLLPQTAEEEEEAASLEEGEIEAQVDQPVPSSLTPSPPPTPQPIASQTEKDVTAAVQEEVLHDNNNNALAAELSSFSLDAPSSGPELVQQQQQQQQTSSSKGSALGDNREEYGGLPEEEDVDYEEDEEAAELEGVDEENQGDHALSSSTLTTSLSSLLPQTAEEEEEEEEAASLEQSEIEAPVDQPVPSSLTPPQPPQPIASQTEKDVTTTVQVEVLDDNNNNALPAELVSLSPARPAEDQQQQTSPSEGSAIDDNREEYGRLPEEEDVDYEKDEEAAELEGVDEENQGDSETLSSSTLTASPSSLLPQTAEEEEEEAASASLEQSEIEAQVDQPVPSSLTPPPPPTPQPIASQEEDDVITAVQEEVLDDNNNNNALAAERRSLSLDAPSNGPELVQQHLQQISLSERSALEDNNNAQLASLSPARPTEDQQQEHQQIFPSIGSAFDDNNNAQLASLSPTGPENQQQQPFVVYFDAHYLHFVCQRDDCGRKFISLSALKVHDRKLHRVVKPYRCLQCTFSYAVKRNLLKHIQDRHFVNKSRPLLKDLLANIEVDSKLLEEEEAIFASAKKETVPASFFIEGEKEFEAYFEGGSFKMQNGDDFGEQHFHDSLADSEDEDSFSAHWEQYRYLLAAYPFKCIASCEGLRFSAEDSAEKVAHDEKHLALPDYQCTWRLEDEETGQLKECGRHFFSEQQTVDHIRGDHGCDEADDADVDEDQELC